MNKIDDYLRNGVVFEDICREDPRAAATYLKELQSRLDQIMKDGTEYAQDMEARLIKRVAQIDELQSQLDSVLVLLREVSESETWELGTDLNRRIEAAIKAPK